MSMATTRPRVSHRVAMFVNPSSRAPRGARLCLARASSAQCRRYAQSSRPLRPQHALQHALAPPGHAHVCIVFARLVNQYALYGGCQAWHRRKCQTCIGYTKTYTRSDTCAAGYKQKTYTRSDTCHSENRKHILEETRVTPSMEKHILGETRVPPSIGKQILNETRVTPSIGKHILGEPRVTPSVGKHIVGETCVSPSIGKHILGETRVTPSIGKRILGETRVTPSIEKQKLGETRVIPIIGTHILGETRDNLH